ncbi:conserved Plasmodium protein, unknown function [Plasmodium gallinaceum]|uniref:Uncharacterized protein n=1 Tax=Plasmodium gallinaceum TaxID=5849 RepID=A0A1J1GRS6_PLAGA|nr:conserved Plasmodium protein, unknown function [Plasmodium gallinaceum]CRG94982.1 conserved Plasmodium protein, unknown function [Plasmodium gallinaceum]
MENDIYSLNILKKYIDDNKNKLNNYKTENDSDKLKNNLFLNLNIPIPTLNHIIDESKSMIASNSSDDKYNYETLKYSKSLLDIIMKISLKKNCFQRNQEYEKKDTNKNDNIIEKKNMYNNKENEETKNENVENKNTEKLSSLHNLNVRNIISDKKEEEINYYPGFCKQLGAKGRRCMLELIRKAYRQNTSLCKNILSHKIKPPACISNLPFFNINMLWKLSYEFGVFEEALKIHKIYGQNSNPLNQYLKKGNNNDLLKNNKNKDTKKKRKKINLFKKKSNNYNDEHNTNVNNNLNMLGKNVKSINNNMENYKNLEKSSKSKYNQNNNKDDFFFYDFKINNNNEQYKKKKRKRKYEEYEMHNKEEKEYVNNIEKQRNLNINEKHKLNLEEFNINKYANKYFKHNSEDDRISLIINKIKKNLLLKKKENSFNNLQSTNNSVDSFERFCSEEESSNMRRKIKSISNGDTYFKICICDCHHNHNYSVNNYSNEMINNFNKIKNDPIYINSNSIEMINNLCFNKKCNIHKMKCINNKLNDNVINNIKKNVKIINDNDDISISNFDNSNENVYELNFLDKLFYNFNDNNAILLNISKKNIFTITCKDNIAGDNYLLLIPFKKSEEKNNNKNDESNRDNIQNSNNTPFINQKNNFNFDTNIGSNKKLNYNNTTLKEKITYHNISDCNDYINENNSKMKNEKIEDNNTNNEWQSFVNIEPKKEKDTVDSKINECLARKYSRETFRKSLYKSNIKNKSHVNIKSFENFNSLLDMFSYNKKNYMKYSQESPIPTDDSTTDYSNLKKSENYIDKNKTSQFFTDEETNNNVSNDCLYSPSSRLTSIDSNKFTHNNKECTQKEKEYCNKHMNDSLNSSFQQIITQCIMSKKGNTIKLLNEIMSNEKNFFNCMKNNLSLKKKINLNTEKYYNDNKKFEKKDLLNFLKQKKKMNNTFSSEKAKSNYIKHRIQKNMNCKNIKNLQKLKYETTMCYDNWNFIK